MVIEVGRWPIIVIEVGRWPKSMAGDADHGVDADRVQWRRAAASRAVEGLTERDARAAHRNVAGCRRRNTASPRSPMLRIVRDAGSGTAPAGVPDSEKFASSSGKEAKGGALPLV